MLSAEIDDFREQRADMLRSLAEQTDANNRFRGELQQLGRQFGAVIEVMEKGNAGLSSQVSELTVQVTASARDSHKLLVMHLDEQKKLRDTIDSYKIEERLAESARRQQHTITSEMEDFQKQRADMLRTLAEQTEATNNFRSELQQFGRQLGTVFNALGSGNSEVSSQISELIVRMAADAKESHRLLAMQIDEQKILRDALDRRTNGIG
jgi:DNA gyrase/topoisomerase IV subunit A